MRSFLNSADHCAVGLRLHLLRVIGSYIFPVLLIGLGILFLVVMRWTLPHS